MKEHNYIFKDFYDIGDYVAYTEEATKLFGFKKLMVGQVLNTRIEKYPSECPSLVCIIECKLYKIAPYSTILKQEERHIKSQYLRLALEKEIITAQLEFAKEQEQVKKRRERNIYIDDIINKTYIYNSDNPTFSYNFATILNGTVNGTNVDITEWLGILEPLSITTNAVTFTRRELEE